MKQEHILAASKNQLNLVLSFFPRVDAKAAAVLAVDFGMAGYLASRVFATTLILSWHLLMPLAAFIFMGLSLWQLYKAAFPNLKGGALSLVYFGTIAKRKENEFIDAFIAQSEESYAKDVLSQAWRNSAILVKKFHHVKCAFIFMSIAIIPWLIAIV